MKKLFFGLLVALFTTSSAQAIQVDASAGLDLPLAAGLANIGVNNVVNGQNTTTSAEWFDDGGSVSDILWQSLDPDIPVGGSGDVWKITINNRVISPAGGWSNNFTGEVKVGDSDTDFSGLFEYIESANVSNIGDCDPSPNPTGSPVPCDDSIPLLGGIPISIPFNEGGNAFTLDLSFGPLMNAAIQDGRVFVSEQEQGMIVVRGTIQKAGVSEPGTLGLVVLSLLLGGLIKRVSKKQLD